jgi:hypothetical protein
MAEQVHLLQAEFLPENVQFLDEMLDGPQRLIVRPAGAAATKLIVADHRALIAEWFEQRIAAGCATGTAMQGQ